MPSAFASEVATKLNAKSFAMPTLPTIAVQVLGLAQDDNSTTRQLAELICRDQSLATNLLRLANSPAFCGARSIVSLQQAVSRLGMQTVAELAVTICVRGSIFPEGGFQQISKSIFAHALATALFAKEVSRQQRQNVEAAYLCGLLHRIGMPIVLKAIGELGSSEAIDDTQVRDLLDQMHRDVGLRASESWDLPSQVFAAIANYEHFQKAEDHRHVAAMVHLSSALATATLAVDEEHDLSELPVLKELSIYPDQLAVLLEHQERIMEAVA